MSDPIKKYKTIWNWIWSFIHELLFSKKRKVDLLDGHTWIYLIIEHPQYSYRCDWSKKVFDTLFAPRLLLIEQPQFRYKKLSTGNKPYFNNINPPQLKRYLTTTTYRDLI